MTATEGETTRPELPDFTTVVDWHASPDPHLQGLADDANLGISISVTLFMPWGVVTGTTISNEKFFSGSGESLIEATRGTEVEGPVQDFVDRQVTPIAEKIAALSSEPNEDLYHQGFGTTSHIHLANPQAHVGGRFVTLPYLRVKLSQVTGWAYGTFID